MTTVGCCSRGGRERSSIPDYRDQELADGVELAAEMLRLIAGRWRSPAEAGRLGHHPLEETMRLVRTLESAVTTLTGDGAPPPEQRGAGSGEERFRLLVDGVTDYAIFLLTPEGRVDSWNAGAERIKG